MMPAHPRAPSSAALMYERTEPCITSPRASMRMLTSLGPSDMKPCWDEKRKKAQNSSKRQRPDDDG